MVSRQYGLLDQLQIFYESDLIELLGFLIDLGILKLWHLIYSTLSTAFGMLILLESSSI